MYTAKQTKIDVSGGQSRSLKRRLDQRNRAVGNRSKWHFPLPYGPYLQPKTPNLPDTLIFSDNAQIAARLSSLLASPQTYVAVIDAPRLWRPDRDAEVIRRINAAACLQPKRILLAGLDDASASALEAKLPRSRTLRIVGNADLADFNSRRNKFFGELVWGHDNIGIGLLQALARGKPSLLKTDRPPKSCMCRRKLLTLLFAS